MKKFSLLFLFVFTLLSCTTESEVLSNDDAFLTILVDDNLISEDTRLFYIAKGEGGVDLAAGELFNANEIELKESTYNDATIAISIFEFQANSERVEISSYLNMPVGGNIRLNKSSNTFPNTSADVAFNNLNASTEEIRIVTSGWFSVANADIIENDQTFSFAFNQDAPFTIVSSLPVNGIPQYQNLMLDTATDNIIDLADNVDMENQHIINTSILSLGNFNYSTQVSGFLPTDTTLSNGYSLYEDKSPDVTDNEITLYSPAAFQDFDLTLTAESNTLRYRQSTMGAVPVAFNFIDPEITVTNSSIANIDVTATGNDTSFINTYWSIENSSEISWSIFQSPSNSINYNIQEIPASILNDVNIQNQLNTVSLQRASAVSIDALGFSDAINKLLTNTTFNTKKINADVILSKTRIF